MKKNSVKLAAVALLMVTIFGSCATKKKYGCPNHIAISRLIGF